MVFIQYRKLYIIRVTWTWDPLCDIYVHFKCSSLNIWGKSALCTLHLTSIFLSLHLPWRQQTLLGFSSLPSFGWCGLNLDTNILVLLWLYPSARLSNHRSEARENSTNLTAATTHAFTGLTRENTLLPQVECGYMCVCLILTLHVTHSHTEKKRYFLLEKQISPGFLFLAKPMFWLSVNRGLVNNNKKTPIVLPFDQLCYYWKKYHRIWLWIYEYSVWLYNKPWHFHLISLLHHARHSSPKNENSVINYSPSCRSKPVRPSIIFGPQIKIF